MLTTLTLRQILDYITLTDFLIVKNKVDSRFVRESIDHYLSDNRRSKKNNLRKASKAISELSVEELTEPDYLINYGAWGPEEISNYSLLLTRYEVRRITNLRVIRRLLFDRKNVMIKGDIRVSPRKREVAPHDRLKKCPSCGRAYLFPWVSGDKTVKIIGCKNCRYSEVI